MWPAGFAPATQSSAEEGDGGADLRAQRKTEADCLPKVAMLFCGRPGRSPSRMEPRPLPSCLGSLRLLLPIEYAESDAG